MNDTAGVLMLAAATSVYLLVFLLHGFASHLGTSRYVLHPAMVTLALTTSLLFGILAAYHG